MIRPQNESKPSPAPGPSFESWLREQVAAEPAWFHRMALRPDLVTPGVSDPAVDKLPYFGLPEDLSGQRVLDIGCAEGFFSFEAERRGAAEVVSIDPDPNYSRRFQLVKIANDSKAVVYRTSIYDLSPRTFGTFDVVFFFGVLYHLRHPMLALERIREVCTGTILAQSACEEPPGFGDEPYCHFYPHGMAFDVPGAPGAIDPTVFFMPNRACVRAFISSAGFEDIETVCDADHVSIVLRAQSPHQAKGQAPDPAQAPWS